MLFTIALPLVVLSIDFAGVAVALPDIAEDFGVPSSDAVWVVDAFALGAAGPLLVAGRVADRVGRRRCLRLGTAVFAVGTLVAAVAPTFGILVGARTLQGAATAVFMTSSLSIVSDAFGPDRRAWAIGMWSAIGSAAAAFAPLVCGAIIGAAGWRVFFALDLPLLALSLWLSGTQLDETFGDRRQVDGIGAALATVAITSVVFALQELGDDGWRSPTVIVPALVGLAVGTAFLAQQRSSTSPLVDPALRRCRPFRPPVAVASLANWGFGAMNVMVTFWLQSTLGLSALQTGAVFLAYSVPFAVLGAFTGRVVARRGTTSPMVLGMVLITVSFGALAAVGTSGGLGLVVVAMVVAGVGQGLAFHVSTTAAMARVDPREGGSASGVLMALRNVGVAAGIALATAATGADGTSMRPAAVALAAVSAAGVVVALRSARLDGDDGAGDGGPDRSGAEFDHSAAVRAG